MKHRLLVCTALCMATGLAQAQYKMNLSDVIYPKIEYLKMGNVGPVGQEIRINNLYLDKGGVPQLPVMGEFHYARMNPEFWKDALLKAKASGVNIVSTYCLWALHEESEGELSWKGHLDLHRFITLCKEIGLKVHLRFGPYCNAEIVNGGLPMWLVNNKQVKKRSNDPLYLAYVRRWYEAVFRQVEGLFHKDGGPIMGLQLENEYVTRGQIIPHLTTLKRMAQEIGFDVPLYSMTHWMDCEYPKGEIVPYAGFYIEAPWTTSGKQEIPTSNFEFFTYNRLSDNIGTDIIKIEGEVQSLSGENNDSPFFTCEVGVGSTTFYPRRAIVPEELAGETINLRLGCGANLMGYYMYVGGTNPVGKLRTFESSGPRVSYDYQAPIRENGTLGAVMPETKKYNYFMNDFGAELAPTVAYLPNSNNNRDNLQWAVRSKDDAGYLFCSNILYRHERQAFKHVQFHLKLKNETLHIPSKKITVKEGTYFLWPFNQTMGKVLLKYATVQPICSLKEGKDQTFFFFEDDQIGGEFLLQGDNIKEVTVNRAVCQRKKNGYFIDQLQAGKDCVITITKNDGTKVRFVVLTEEQSDMLWKGKTKNREFVALTSSSLIYNDQHITLIDDAPQTSIDLYDNGTFQTRNFKGDTRRLNANLRALRPMEHSRFIAPAEGSSVTHTFQLQRFAEVQKAFVRMSAPQGTAFSLNGQTVQMQNLVDYQRADVTKLLRKGEANALTLTGMDTQNAAVAEVEILMTNGERILWNTDATWTSAQGKVPAVMKEGTLPKAFAPEEHLAVYELNAPAPVRGEEETRMYIRYKGDVANAYINGQLVADNFYDGADWIVSLSRQKSTIDANPMVIRIDGLKSADAPIYFEKHIDPSLCVQPELNEVEVKQEYRFTF